MRSAFIALSLSTICCGSAWSADLRPAADFTALASDRIAHDVGDSLTVLVYEASSATRASTTRTSRQGNIEARAADGSGPAAQGQAGLSGRFDGAGQNARSGNLVAQISVVVQSIAPNGDLVVAGEQMLNIDGEKTRIRVRGTARPADISSGNAIISTRLSDVAIDYDGRGFATRSARPGVIGHVLNWLGVL